MVIKFFLFDWKNEQNSFRRPFTIKQVPQANQDMLKTSQALNDDAPRHAQFRWTTNAFGLARWQWLRTVEENLAAQTKVFEGTEW